CCARSFLTRCPSRRSSDLALRSWPGWDTFPVSSSRTPWLPLSITSLRNSAMAETPLFDRGMATRRAVLGDQHVDGATARKTDFEDRKSTRLNSSHVKISYA